MATYEASPSSSMYPTHRVPLPPVHTSYERLARTPSPPPFSRYSSRDYSFHDPSNSSKLHPPRVWPDREAAYMPAPSSPNDLIRAASWGSPSGWTDPSAIRGTSTRMFEPNDGWKRRNTGNSAYSSSYSFQRSPDGPLSSPRSARGPPGRRPSILQPRTRLPPRSPDVTQKRGVYHKPADDDNPSSAASLRATSLPQRRPSPDRGRVWTPRSPSISPRRRTASDSRSASGHASPARSRHESPVSRRPAPTSARLEPRSPSSARSYFRQATRSLSRSSSLLRDDPADRPGKRNDTSRGRSLSRTRTSSHRSSTRSGSDSIASSRASTPPKAETKQIDLLVLPPSEAVPPLAQKEDTQSTSEDMSISPPAPEEIAVVLPQASPTVVELPFENANVEVRNREEGIIMSPIPMADPNDKATYSEPGPSIAKESANASSIMSVDIPEHPALSPPKSRLSVDFTVDDIPTTRDTLRDSLRITVMTRILCHRQSREDMVEPVLRSNRELVSPLEERPGSSPDQVVAESFEGDLIPSIVQRHNTEIATDLAATFRRLDLAHREKLNGLRKAYLALNERWKAHCALLDSQDKRTMMDPETVVTAGRPTRRSAATIGYGDLVRSDLEMEQIIASLGNDDATDPSIISTRNRAKIPDMVSVSEGHLRYVYDDNNLLVDDPLEYYRPHTGMDDWTPEEEAIFLDQFAEHPKQFGIIADALPYKTAAQCVAFYYLHKKRTIDFRKVVTQYAPKRKRRRTGKQKANALLADIRQHDAEVSAEIEATGTGRVKRATVARRVALEETPTATPTPEPDGRPKRRRAAAVRSNLAEVDEDDIEEARPNKRARKSRKAKTDESTSESSRRKPSASVHQWSDNDRQTFLKLFKRHGTDFKRIAAEMPSQTTARVAEFYKANWEVLGLDRLPSQSGSVTPASPAMGSIPLDDDDVRRQHVTYLPMTVSPGVIPQYAPANYAIPGSIYGTPPLPYPPPHTMQYHAVYPPPFLSPLITSHPSNGTPAPN